MKPSMSVVITALNEEGDLTSSVEAMLAILDDRFSSFEIIIINDGSTDRTPQIADRFSSENPHIRVVHHQKNMGLGYSIREGYDLATKDYVIWRSGDQGMRQESFDSMFNMIGQQDLIIPYINNPEFRPLSRRFVSRLYILILNAIFGLKLKCYNGSVIYPTRLSQAIRTSTLGFFFFSEMLISAVKGGATYVEVPTLHGQRIHGKSKAFSFKNVFEILSKALALAWHYRFHKAKKIVLSNKPQALQLEK
ncbi:MAG: glycosyltransferase family 2 protein [Candidatus Omnitrophica bacterium]|nr:glycosyltransferase family 2 protein [Candidatus Omnitrophota bacterium]